LSDAVIELAARVPIQLSPVQAVLVIVVVAGVILALVLGPLLDTLFTGFAGFLLRLTGHRPPTKGPVATALDELEARLDRERRERESREPPESR
jgi:hypothetical protein